MTKTTRQWMMRSLVAAATVVLAGCAENEPTGPVAQASVLQTCSNLNVPAGSELLERLFARGVQIYRWNGTSWTFVAPSAELFPNAKSNKVIGTHYAGPTWESVSGSKVVGSLIDRCPVDANSIPWLLLGAVSVQGSGMFNGTTHIQRLNTVGGVAPSTPGNSVGEIANVPYTTEYYFYRAQQ